MMDPKTYFLLCGVVMSAVILIASRRYIRFRWNFGVWQGQRGADRLVREVMKAHVAKIVSAIEARKKATAAFEECINLPVPMAARRKDLAKAERTERSLNRRYVVLRGLAKEFMMVWEVKIADEELQRAKMQVVK